MPDARLENRTRLSPRGWRASLRGILTTLGFGLRADPTLFVFLFSVDTISALLGLVATYATKLLVDAATTGDTSNVLLAAAAIHGALAIQGLCGHQYVNTTVKLEEKTQLLLDQRLMAVVGGVPGIEHLERPEYVDELALLRDSRQLLGQVANALVLNLRITIQLIGGTLLLASLHPVLSLLPIFAVPSLIVGRRTADRIGRVQQSNVGRDRIVRALFECATKARSGKELRLFGLTGELIERSRCLSTQSTHEYDRAEGLAVRLGLLGAFSFAAGQIGAVGIVLARAFAGQATPGDVVLALTLTSQVNTQLAAAVRMANYLHRAAAATTRYLWLDDYATAAIAGLGTHGPPPERLKHGLTLREVSFSYPGTDKRVLDGVTAELPAGSVIAIVGENGAGKTTLVKLLCRFYEPESGLIKVDGKDLSSLDLTAWRQRISVALQDFQQFEFLVRESVGVGDLPLIEDSGAVGDALERAGSENLSRSLPMGLETQLGKSWPGGIEPSGGQWQRLALGRAFMRRQPLLVVFDEPTAAIDAPTEHSLFERFAAAARSPARAGAVTLIVSHRFSTVRMADLILVMDRGKILEQGSHAELMKLGGLYASMYGLQARAYR